MATINTNNVGSIKSDEEVNFWSEIKRDAIDELDLSTFYFRHEKKEHMSFKGDDLLKCLKKAIKEHHEKGQYVPKALLDKANTFESNGENGLFGKAAFGMALKMWSQGSLRNTNKSTSKRFHGSHRYVFADEESLQMIDDRLEIEAHQVCNYNLDQWPLVRITIVGYQRSDEKFQSVYLDGLTNILENHKRNEHCVILYDLTEYKIFPKKQMEAQLAWQTKYDALVKERCHGISVIVTTKVVRGFLNMLTMVQDFPVDTKFFKNEQMAMNWMVKIAQSNASRIRAQRAAKQDAKKKAAVAELRELAVI